MTRLNISLDILRADRNRELIRRNFLLAVLKGVDEALAVGFTPLKFNFTK